MAESYLKITKEDICILNFLDNFPKDIKEIDDLEKFLILLEKDINKKTLYAIGGKDEKIIHSNRCEIEIKLMNYYPKLEKHLPNCSKLELNFKKYDVYVPKDLGEAGNILDEYIYFKDIEKSNHYIY